MKTINIPSSEQDIRISISEIDALNLYKWLEKVSWHVYESGPEYLIMLFEELGLMFED